MEQIKLFSDYENQYPDNPKEVALNYIEKFKTNHLIEKNKLKKWEDLYHWVIDENNIKKCLIKLLNYKKDDSDYLNSFIENLCNNTNNIFFDNLNQIKIFIEKNILKKINWNFLTLKQLNYLYLKSYFLYEYNYKIDDKKLIINIIKSLNYDQIFKYHSNYYYYKLLDWINYDFSIEYRDVYRAIKINSKLENINNISYNGVGLFWTYNKKMANVYETNVNIEDNHNLIILSSKILPIDINIETTLLKCFWDCSEECEIQLNKNTTIDITSMYIISEHPFFYKRKNKDIEYLKTIFNDFEYLNSIKLRKIENVNFILFKQPIIVKT